VCGQSAAPRQADRICRIERKLLLGDHQHNQPTELAMGKGHYLQHYSTNNANFQISKMYMEFNILYKVNLQEAI
jgi:hypothetical protein